MKNKAKKYLIVTGLIIGANLSYTSVANASPTALVAAAALLVKVIDKHGHKLGEAAGNAYCKAKGPNCGGASK